MELSALIHNARTKHGLTQADLGSLVGVGVQMVSAVERGARLPSAPVLARMCMALKLDAAEVIAIVAGLGGQDDEPGHQVAA